MAKINTKKIHSYFVQQLKSWVDELPDDAKNAPFVTTAGSRGKKLTPKQVLQHVRKATPLGVQLMENAAALAMSDSVIGAAPSTDYGRAEEIKTALSLEEKLGTAAATPSAEK